MMTVRFSDGTSIRYNNANFVTRHSGFSDLLEKEGGCWIAQVPNTAVIEVLPACEVFNPVIDRTSNRIASLEREVRGLRRQISQLVKKGKAR